MLRLWLQRKMAVVLFLGFASGLPLYLTSRALQAWLKKDGVDLTTIGLFSLVALPYSLKFLWAPVIDRVVPPFLGRRRGWMIITQIAVMLAVAAMSMQHPATALRLFAINAVFIAFFSASQDILVDAYRIDVLSDRELGAGAAIGVLGYRLALIVTGAVAFMLADRMPWQTVYLIMSLLMLLGIAATLMAPEPTAAAKPESLYDAVYLPFREFLSRRGAAIGLGVLGFIVVYKLPDALAGQMATPFLLEAGYAQSDIGAIQGGVGIVATIVGALIGGSLVARTGINRSLWIFGVLQAVSNLAYYGLTRIPPSRLALTGAMVTENFCTGLVTAGFVAYLMSLCNPRFSATQYALVSSLLGVSRDLLSTPTGAIAKSTGWPTFFLITIASAIPGFLLLPILAPWSKDRPVLAVAENPPESELI